MKAFLIFLLFGLVCAGVTIVSLSMIMKNSHSAATTVNKVAKPKVEFTAAQLASIEVVNGDEKLLGRAISKKVKDLLEKEDFDGLETMAGDFRKSKAQIANGIWHLSTFYNNVSGLPRGTVEADWKARLEVLNRWVAAKPDSITARIALAEYYSDYGWDARGNGYGNTVSEEAWKLYRERHRQSKNILMDAKKLEQKCPMWWASMQGVALAEAWKRPAYDKLFDEAIAFELENTACYKEKANYLLPRWFGKKEGVWQQFAAEASDKLGGEAGDILYARLGWKFHERRFYDRFLKDSKYSWPRMKKGLEAIIRRYPESLTAPSELAFLAVQASDRPCAKLMFERIGSKVDNSVWRGDKARFLTDRAWALSK